VQPVAHGKPGATFQPVPLYPSGPWFVRNPGKPPSGLVKGFSSGFRFGGLDRREFQAGKLHIYPLVDFYGEDKTRNQRNDSNGSDNSRDQRRFHKIKV